MLIPLCTTMLPLKPGKHRFQIKVAIPENLPSSFESQFGSVRYTIKLTLITNAQHVLIFIYLIYNIHYIRF